jgi:lipopolysaccharide/colanic/teichoic acid biosynthesis glycosyltransferase
MDSLELTNGRKAQSARAARWSAILEARLAAQRPGVGVRVGPVPPRVVVGPLTDRENGDGAERRTNLLRRNVNIAAAAILLILALPLMLLIAVAIRLTSPGPIIFTQARVGLDRRRDDPNVPVDPRRRVDHGGRIFQIYKFRTMTHEPEEDRKQVWASPTDPRVTPVGRFLRKYRLDELPQLVNVLMGDMNLVGPRPEQPEIFKTLREEIDGYQGRQRVLPGITGLAQVSHGYDHSVDDVRTKVGYDLSYVEQKSPLEDLRIMAQTVPVVLFGKGAI